MGFSDLWRDRGRRERAERERDQWRSGSRNPEDERNYGGRDYEMQDEDFERRGWRPGGDYYGNTAERFGGRYGGTMREQQSGRSGYEGSRRPYSEAGSESDEELYGGGQYKGSSWQDRVDWRRYGSGAGSGGATGSFRGRGPRGYRRSDDRIREDVCECLTDDNWIDASNMEVAVEDCEVTLSGTVDSREEKRRAEELAERVSGVRDVHNTLRVTARENRQREGTIAQGTSTQGTSASQSQSAQTEQSSRH